MKKILKIISFTVVLLMSFSAIIYANTVDSFQITYNGTQQNGPIIHKNLVVWTDWRGDLGLGIWGYDLETDTEFPIISDRAGEQRATDLSEKYLIYNDHDGVSGENDVKALNLKTGEDILVAGGTTNQSNGQVSNDFVAYIEGNACGKLIGVDMKSMESTLIYDGTCYTFSLYGNTIIYPVNAYGGTDLYGYDIKKKEHFPVAVKPGFQDLPYLYKNRLVYKDHIGGGLGTPQSIVLKNIKSGTEEVLYSSETVSLDNPHISENYLAWSESPEKHTMGMYGMDLKSGEVFEIMEVGNHQNSRAAVDIWKNTVVWMAWRTGNGDIYGASLSK